MDRSVFHFFLHQVHNRGDQPSLRFKQHGQWQDMTWAALRGTQRALSAALLAEGLGHQDKVSILANTRWQWMAADLGSLGAGCVTVPIYPSNLADECAYILKDAGARVVFVEDAGQLEKLMARRAELEAVQRVVLMEGDVPSSAEGWAVGWDAFVRRGDRHLEQAGAQVDAASEQLGPDDVLTIIYTSGTTGRPKGVVLTHDNFIYEAGVAEESRLVVADDVQLLFLPMAHVFAKIIEVCWLKLAHVLALAESIEKLSENMVEVRPTVMAAVPRIYERVYSAVVQKGSAEPGLKGRLFRMAVVESQAAGAAKDAGQPYASVRWSLARRLVFPKIAQTLADRFGGRLRFFISGGAPLSRKIGHFMAHAGVQICEGYGLTETSAASTINLPQDIRVGTVGQAIQGTAVRIAEDGEILIRGRGVMRGYWNNPEATAEVLQPDGWFHTGDIGQIDADGFVRITDRKKDIIVTAGGKNVAPQNIENLLKTYPLISQCMVYGDRRKFLSALVTLNEEAALAWAAAQQLGVYNVAELAAHPALIQFMQQQVDDLNQQLASYETLKKFAVVEKDFTVGDELTPTLKVKRKHTSQKYKALLDGFYGDDRFD